MNYQFSGGKPSGTAAAHHQNGQAQDSQRSRGRFRNLKAGKTGNLFRGKFCIRPLNFTPCKIGINPSLDISAISVHVAVVGQLVKQGTIHIDLHRLALVCASNG